MSIYNKIYDFCKVKNKGGCHQNGSTPSPRVLFLIELLKSEGIEYELDEFISNNLNNYWNKPDDKEPNKFYNIILRGKSNRMVVAHHDIVNPNSDNANDNSASVINCISIKKQRPDINVVLLDGEESGGIGSNRLGKQISEGEFGKIEWVLNLELTGKGGSHFFIGQYPGKLNDKIVSIFNCPIVSTPYNDAVTLRRYGIDSTVINPLPPLPKKPDDLEEEIEENDDVEFDFDDDFEDMYIGRFKKFKSFKNQNIIKKAKKSVSNFFKSDPYTSPVKTSDGIYLNYNLLYNCHSMNDSVSTIDPKDMKEFVENIVLKILDS